MAGSSTVAELALVGAGGEPVDLWRTISSHGVADLPPNRIDDEQRTLEVTVRRGSRQAEDRRHLAGEAGLRAGRAAWRQGRRRARHRPPHARAGRRPLAVLRARGGRPGPGLGGQGRGADAAEPDRFRGGRQDDLHDELRLVRDRAHGQLHRRASRHSVGGRVARAVRARVPDSRGDGGSRRRLLPRHCPCRLPRGLPARARNLGRRRRAGHRVVRRGPGRALRTKSSRSACSRSPASAPTPRPTS